MYSICLIEDNEDFTQETVEYLGNHGFDVSHHSSAQGMVEWVSGINPDLAVLDQFVDGADCVTMIPALRQHFASGIVVLTGNQSKIDRIVALECGADDFVDKAAGPRELLARLRAIIRRLHPTTEGAGAGTEPSSHTDSGWSANRLMETLEAPNGRSVRLTGAEFATLMYLEDRAGQPVSRAELSESICRRPYSSSDRSVDNIVSRVRKALDSCGVPAPVIRPVRGVGYVFSGLGNPFGSVRRGGGES
jgi:DNA-binding response OmpR family regulator